MIKFRPSHISFNSSRFKNCITNKHFKIQKNQKDFRPFGADLGTFIDFQYETTSGRVTSLFPQNGIKRQLLMYTLLLKLHLRD